MTFEIDIRNTQNKVDVDCDALVAALEKALRIEGVSAAVLSVSIVDNAAIHVINRDHLQHDYPTDVISFQLDFRTGDESSGEDSFGDPWEEEFSEDAFDAEGSSDAANDEEDELDDDNQQCSPERLRGMGAEVSTGAEDSDSVPSEGLRAAGAMIEGEIIASAEMAAEMAADGGFAPQSELTLYVVHGMLHICGYDDLTPEEQAIMRVREAVIMQSLQLTTRSHNA